MAHGSEHIKCNRFWRDSSFNNFTFHTFGRSTLPSDIIIQLPVNLQCGTQHREEMDGTSGPTTDTDVRTIFRKLVTNVYIPNFDYQNTKFAFKTVHYFPENAIMYRCCPCAFEHEYLDYIGIDGQIDEEMYNKIEQSIVDGQCPHVNQAKEDEISTTEISSITIPLVLGTTGVQIDHHTLVQYKRGGLKCSSLTLANPLKVAIIKNLSTPSSAVVSFLAAVSDLEPCEQRSMENKCEAVVKSENVLSVCIRNKNLNEKLLEALPLHKITPDVLRSAFQSRDRNLFHTLSQKILSQKILSVDGSSYVSSLKEPRSKECCRLAIVYNLSEILQEHIRRSLFFKNKNELDSFLKTCFLLDRHRCKDFILTCSEYELRKELPLSESVKGKLQLLLEFYDDTEIRDEILNSLTPVPGPVDYREQEEFLQAFATREFQRSNNIEVITKLLDLGSDLYSISRSSGDIINALLQEGFGRCRGFRQRLELLLYENPNIKDGESLMKTGLKFDALAYLHNSLAVALAFEPNRFLMDAQYHSRLVHAEEEFTLNFLVPLLSYCGVQCSANVLMSHKKSLAMSLFIFVDEYLHPAEDVYLKQMLDNPRSLKLRCRDVLRKHFQGRKIHRYAEVIDMPKPIKDFILLKPVLKTLTDDLFV